MHPWFSAPSAARIVVVSLVVAFLGGCSAAGGATVAPTIAPASPAPTAATTLAVTPAPTPRPTRPTTAGLFEARGHRLNLKCEGDSFASGGPTIVYIHGMSPEPPDSGIRHGDYIAPFLYDDDEFCSYDRANVGASDTVDGKQTARDAVLDLHALLQSAHVPGPYLLLGASFGGLVAYEYAVTYPDDVAGMVVLDPTLPREYLDIDPYFHPVDGLLTGDEWKDNREHMDWLGSMQETQVLEGREPRIPLIYLALVHPDTWWKPVTPESMRAYRAMQHRFVDLWSPGTYVEVDTDHYMEPVIPQKIADYVRQVIAQIPR